MSLDLDRAAETFAEASDFTVGVEEEFSILDPQTLDLVPRFEELRAAAEGDPLLHEGITGELICSEIEIISGVGADLHDALARQRDRRGRLFALAAAHGAALGATGTHPWADYREQPIIDTEHYRRVEEGLKYVAWRNNTFSLHVHVGVRDIDRAVRVCDRLEAGAAAAARDLRELALSGRPRHGPSLGADAELHQELSPLRRSRCVRRLAGLPRVHRVPRADALDRRVHPGVVVGQAALQLRHRRGAHLRRAGDAHRSRTRSPALMVACIAQAMRDVDEGVPFSDPAPRLIEENMWRAIRFGLDGRLIDLDARRGVSGAGGDRAAGRVDGADPRRARHRSRVSRAATAPSASGG